MSIRILSSLLAAILTFVIGWSVLLRDRRQGPYVTFAILCFNLCGWYLAHFFATTLQNEYVGWASMFIAAAIPANADRFFRYFLADDPRRRQRPSRAILIGTVVVYALFGVSLFYPLHRSMLFLAPLYGFVFASLYNCVYLIYRRKRSSSSRHEATKLTYLLYGGAASVTLAATDFMPNVGMSYPTLGNVLSIIYLYFISQTLFHYRLLDIKELLGKMAALSALVLILTVIYGLLLIWVGPDRPGVFFFNTIVASFVILVIFEPLRTWLEARLNRWLFAERYQFSHRLRQLARDLANIIEVRPLVFHLLSELERSGRATHASVYLPDPTGTNFRLAGHVGPTPMTELDGRTRRLLFERLREGGPITVDGLEHALAEQLAHEHESDAVATRNVLDALQEVLADVSIPLLAEGQLLGILNLRDDRFREAYATDELELLRQVAAQAAITLHNSKIYEQMKERDRLAALGQMAAGLAHEIRNPLGAIKGAAQLLKADLHPETATAAPTDAPGVHSPPTAGLRHSDGDEQLTDFLNIIVEEVDRLDHVVSQFLGYARPDRGKREALNINEVMHKTLQLLRSHADTVNIVADLASDLPQVHGDPDQLQQVFLNLAINGIQAMEQGGNLEVSTRLRHGFRSARWAGDATRIPGTAPVIEVTFRDHGRGIPPEQLSDIFIPFFTTRQGGTGLGLPICQRIIESHEGSIQVQSEYGRGSCFSVVLPTVDQVEVTGQIST